ncbi:hypothetical protein N9S30_00105 [bacterium]|nr:hypothetical protein [bacterium]
MTFRFLIIDATESTEVQLYVVDGRDAPGHVKRYLANTGMRTFENIYEDSAETLAGLVNEESDRADERAEEVWEWLHGATVAQNVFVPGVDRQVITHTISMVSA